MGGSRRAARVVSAGWAGRGRGTAMAVPGVPVVRAQKVVPGVLVVRVASSWGQGAVVGRAVMPRMRLVLAAREVWVGIRV